MREHRVHSLAGLPLRIVHDVAPIETAMDVRRHETWQVLDHLFGRIVEHLHKLILLARIDGENTQGPQFGVFGYPRVNVFEVNLALDNIAPQTPGK
jgi:hypothetical protein